MNRASISRKKDSKLILRRMRSLVESVVNSRRAMSEVANPSLFSRAS
jgi:hypothetical protein